jgi:hypothetical protein
MNQKLNMEMQNLGKIASIVVEFAAAKPDTLFYLAKSAIPLLEQRKFEAAGKVDMMIWLHIAVFKHSKSLLWQQKPWYSRYMMLKGLCGSLGLDCPMDSMLFCWDDEASRANLQLFHEWMRAIATGLPEKAYESALEFLSGRGKELLELIPKSALECDKRSNDFKLISEKLGYDTWSEEWIGALLEYPREFPVEYWHFKISQYQLIEENDLEGNGVTIGLIWYRIAEWKRNKAMEPMEISEL